MTEPKVHSSAVRWAFFWVGILATFSYRIIIILNNVSDTWLNIAWYVGTVGFIIYFIHRFDVSRRRAALIAERSLDEKIRNNAPLAEEDRAALNYILGTLRSTKEKWNFVFIFTTSGIALIIGLILDLT